jgi:hypothetical protein
MYAWDSSSKRAVWEECHGAIRTQWDNDFTGAALPTTATIRRILRPR